MSTFQHNSANSRSYALAAEQLRGNVGQWDAYNSTGHAVVLAGPGSGKTKTLTIKLARILAEDVRRPQGVACITFNNECVRELRHRLEALGVEEGHNVFVGTVHSFCLNAVVLPYAQLAGADVPNPLGIATKQEQLRLITKSLSETISADEKPETWLDRVARHKQAIRDSDNLEIVESDDALVRLIGSYTVAMNDAGQIDFDDIVIHGRRLIENHHWIRRAVAARFPVLVVDEYQDLGLSLHKIVLSLAQDAGCRLLAVGDADQSIYGFAGARPELLLGLAEQLSVDPIRLRLNYRSGSRIVTASEIALGVARNYKSGQSEEGSIAFHECDDALDGQAKFICDELIPTALQRRNGRTLGQIAVLYTTRFIGDAIAVAARNASYDYIRADQNALYRSTPLTRWMEECAGWCAGGWKSGVPRLSSLIQTWQRLNRGSVSDSQRRFLKLSLVHFLMSNRESSQSFHDWLTTFCAECLDNSLTSEPLLSDERQVVSDLNGLAKPDGAFEKFSVASFAGQGGSESHLNLMTLHNAKGLEFDVAILLGMDQGIIPWNNERPEALRESRRKFYVGVTRARHEVHLTYSGFTVDRNGNIRRNGPSQFLLELRKKLDG